MIKRGIWLPHTATDHESLKLFATIDPEETGGLWALKNARQRAWGHWATVKLIRRNAADVMYHPSCNGALHRSGECPGSVKHG